MRPAPALAARRVDAEDWSAAVAAARRGPTGPCSACGASAARVHMALLDEAGRRDRRRRAWPAPTALSRRSARCMRRRSASSARSPTCTAWRRWRCPTPGPGSTMAAGACAIRSARAAARRRRPSTLPVPAGRGREPAPDPGRPGPCRHHRARPFPLHRQRRDRGAAGGAAGLRPQGHRGPDGGRRPRPRGAGSPAAPRATARSPMRFAFARAAEAALGVEAPPRARLAARADGRAGAAGQPSRRHRRDLQRCRLRADACPLRRAARARAARRRGLLRPPPDDGSHRARRRRRRPRAGDGVAALARPDRRAAAGASRALVELYDNTASLQDRTVGTGMLDAGARRAVRRRRLRRPRLGPRLRRAPGAGLSAL